MTTRKPKAANRPEHAHVRKHLSELLALKFPAPPTYDPKHPERAGVTFLPDGDWSGVCTPDSPDHWAESLRLVEQMRAHLAVHSPEPQDRRQLALLVAHRLGSSDNPGDRWAAWVLARLIEADLGDASPPAGLPHLAPKAVTVTRQDRARRRARLLRAWLERDATHPKESIKARAAALHEAGKLGMELKQIEAIAYSQVFKWTLEAARAERAGAF